MVLNIHVMFNNKMKSFILNRFRSEKVAETAHLPFRHREALCSNINHPRKTLEVKTWQRLTLLAELTLCTFYSNINLYNVFSLFLLAKQFTKCSTYLHMFSSYRVHCAYYTMHEKSDNDKKDKLLITMTIHGDDIYIS